MNHETVKNGNNDINRENIYNYNNDNCNNGGKGSNKIFIFAGLGLILFTLFFLFSFIIPGVEKSKKESNLNLCYNNIKRLSVQLDSYKKQNGRYPQSLEKLVPDYFKGLPVCPQINEDTYSEGYIVNDDGSVFTLFCRGNHHTDLGIPPNFPFYSSKEGLVRKR